MLSLKTWLFCCYWFGTSSRVYWNPVEFLVCRSRCYMGNRQLQSSVLSYRSCLLPLVGETTGTVVVISGAVFMLIQNLVSGPVKAVFHWGFRQPAQVYTIAKVRERCLPGTDCSLGKWRKCSTLLRGPKSDWCPGPFLDACVSGLDSAGLDGAVLIEATVQCIHPVTQECVMPSTEQDTGISVCAWSSCW